MINKDDSILISLIIFASLLSSCTQASIHGPSLRLRLPWLLADLAKMEQACLVQNSGNCFIPDLPLSRNYKWGKINVLSAGELEFENHIVQLHRSGQLFCFFAKPISTSKDFPLWVDAKMERHWLYSASDSIPPSCQGLSLVK